MWSGAWEDLLNAALERQCHGLPAGNFLEAKGISRHADFLLRVTETYEFAHDGPGSDVMYTAVVILDRYVSTVSTVELSALSSLAFAALYLAAKAKGVIIPVRMLASIPGQGHSENQIKRLELEILAVLNWQLDIITPCDFLDHFCTRLPFTITAEELDIIRQRAQYFANAIVLDPVYVIFGPALIAAAALYLAIVGVDGSQKISPLFRDIPPRLISSYFGLSQLFPQRKNLLIKCVKAMKIASAPA